MHLISALSLWAGTLGAKMVEFYNSQIPPSEGPGSTSTNTLSRMLPTLHFELLGKRRIWVTTYQELQTSRSTPESNDAPKEWTRWEVLFRRLKTLNPCRQVKSVVIHIYPFCIPFSLKLLTFLKWLVSYSCYLEKKIKILKIASPMWVRSWHKTHKYIHCGGVKIK